MFHKIFYCNRPARFPLGERTILSQREPTFKYYTRSTVCRPGRSLLLHHEPKVMCSILGGGGGHQNLL